MQSEVSVRILVQEYAERSRPADYPTPVRPCQHGAHRQVRQATDRRLAAGARQGVAGGQDEAVV